MAKYKAIVEYRGTNYSGMQKQRGHTTIQDKLETALGTFYQQETPIEYSGRTDTGVHAFGQVITFNSNKINRKPHNILHGVNLYLAGQQIALLSVEEATEDFHCRFDATQRYYIYKIINRSAPLILDADRALWIHDKLNVKAMQDASAILLGKHDFSAFRSSDCQALNPLRTLSQLSFESYHNTNNDHVIKITFAAKSFLHHMVRNMVGSLLQIGKNKKDATWLYNVLKNKDRKLAAFTAPAHGLYLWKVEYRL